MKKVYLDNASTTPLREEVILEMTKVLTHDYGNPSSNHTFGRASKSILEQARKNIATLHNASAQEIIFTSCGTEANNLILQSSVRDLQVKRIISSKIEHHAVLHTLEALKKTNPITIDYVSILPNGTIDLEHLEKLLSIEGKKLVSLMHVNNETGAALDLLTVANLCKKHNAYFHTDTVQSMGKYHFDLKEIPIDFLVASAHKFHGPKGIGFAYIKKGIPLQPILLGGEQEKGLRAGTESVHNIAGMAKALELAYSNLDQERQIISELKAYTVQVLDKNFPGIQYSLSPSLSIYTILNIILPFSPNATAMLLFQLDMKGIAVSRGSACQSGSTKPSHVLSEMLSKEELEKPNLRISFSHFNTKEEIDYLIECLSQISRN